MSRVQGAAGPAVLAAACLLVGVAGCAPATGRQAAAPITVTMRAVPSALVAVVSGAPAGPGLARLIAATARSGENVDVAAAGTATVLAESTAPPPARVAVPGAPAGPGAGATSFQRAGYRRSLASWKEAVARARATVTTRTRAALAAWAASLHIAVRAGAGPARRPGGLAAACAVAASALAGLNQAAGASFGGRRVVVLYVSALGSTVPSGELSGADVIVVTPFLPAAAAVTAAQAGLLAAGAGQARVVGPEATSGQLALLVARGLSQKVVTDSLSGAALFANDSARLAPGAARVLRPLIAPLREPGAAAVINGYASAPGTSLANYLLSYSRAAAVAGFLEASGIPASSLFIVGHGASDLVAPGAAAANRRVVVVVEEPAV